MPDVSPVFKESIFKYAQSYQNVTALGKDVLDIRMTLSDQYQQALPKAEYGSEKPLIVGDSSMFDAEELFNPERKIFIHLGKVHVVSVPCLAHETSAGYLIHSILMPILQRFGNDSYYPSGSPTVRVCNRLGCHCSFGKIPDGSLRADESIVGHVLPTVIIEVAVHNESLDDLMLEGRAWIDHPAVQYVVLLKVWPATLTLPRRAMPTMRTSDLSRMFNVKITFAKLMEISSA